MRFSTTFARVGEYAKSALGDLASRHPSIAEVRGLGLMLGVELVGPDGEPNSAAAAAVQRGAIERGLIIELGGRGDCVVRFLPALNVTREILDQAIEILDAALTDAERDSIGMALSAGPVLSRPIRRASLFRRALRRSRSRALPEPRRR